MVKQYKIDEVNNLVEKIENRKNLVLTDYSGVTVQSLSSLRKQLREKNAEYKVVKNNLLKLALKETGYEGLNDYIRGPVAVAFVNDEIAEVAKILKDFSKEEDKFSFSAGYLDNSVFDKEQMAKIAELPSREVLLGQIMSLLNGPAQGMAIGMNEIMSSLARGINAVAEKNNK
jgi:large subunit ribosomal protein L10